MNIDYIFPHPIAVVDLEIDNSYVLKTVDALAKNITEEDANHSWDCKVVSSFNHDNINKILNEQCTELFDQVTQQGQQFCDVVGWEDTDNPSIITSAWFNKYTESHHSQEAHHHGKHHICAIYYATPDLTPTVFVNPNSYTFHTSYEEAKNTEVTKVSHKVLPQPGQLVLFPGYMMHTVPHVRDQIHSEYDIIKNRVTIAFNFGKSVH